MIHTLSCHLICDHCWLQYVEFGARSQEPPNKPQGPIVTRSLTPVTATTTSGQAMPMVAPLSTTTTTTTTVTATPTQAAIARPTTTSAIPSKVHSVNQFYFYYYICNTIKGTLSQSVLFLLPHLQYHQRYTQSISFISTTTSAIPSKVHSVNQFYFYYHICNTIKGTLSQSVLFLLLHLQYHQRYTQSISFISTTTSAIPSKVHSVNQFYFYYYICNTIKGTLSQSVLFLLPHLQYHQRYTQSISFISTTTSAIPSKVHSVNQFYFYYHICNTIKGTLSQSVLFLLLHLQYHQRYTQSISFISTTTSAIPSKVHSVNQFYFYYYICNTIKGTLSQSVLFLLLHLQYHQRYTQSISFISTTTSAIPSKVHSVNQFYFYYYICNTIKGTLSQSVLFLLLHLQYHQRYTQSISFISTTTSAIPSKVHSVNQFYFYYHICNTIKGTLNQSVLFLLPHLQYHQRYTQSISFISTTTSAIPSKVHSVNQFYFYYYICNTIKGTLSQSVLFLLPHLQYHQRYTQSISFISTTTSAIPSKVHSVNQFYFYYYICNTIKGTLSQSVLFLLPHLQYHQRYIQSISFILTPHISTKNIRGGYMSKQNK